MLPETKVAPRCFSSETNSIFSSFMVRGIDEEVTLPKIITFDFEYLVSLFHGLFLGLSLDLSFSLSSALSLSLSIDLSNVGNWVTNYLFIAYPSIFACNLLVI